MFVADVGNLQTALGTLDQGKVPPVLFDAFNLNRQKLSNNVRIRKKTEQLAAIDPRRWVIEDNFNDVTYVVRIEHEDDFGQGTLAVHEFDDWYDYQYTRADGRVIQSYWREPKGIDQGEPSFGKYATHLLIGHHGIFSLTPVWLLMIPGVVLLARPQKGYGYRALAALVGIVTIVCIAFYLLRPPLDRNYGGMTSAFRWVFWLAPLWLIAALPAADWLAAKRWGRVLAYVLLALSVLAVVYPTWNPWTYPWLTNFWLYMHWEQF
jgi:hypothetical protein